MPERSIAAALVLLAALCGVADADGDRVALPRLRDQLDAASDPADRVRIVRQIGASTEERAVAILARAAREDPSVAVRVAAVETLGRIDCDRATVALVDLALLGGVRKLRAATGVALGARADGVESVVGRLGRNLTDPLDVERLVDVLGDVPGDFAIAQLDFLARSPDSLRRAAALRALSRHRKGAATLRALLADSLRRYPDVDTLRTTLDVAFETAGPEMRDALRAVAPGRDAGLRAALEAVHARLDYLDAVARRRATAAQGTEYAPSEDSAEPVPPLPPVRIDLVYMFDATGSMWGTGKDIRARIDSEVGLWLAVGADVRVAVVAFRDRKRESWDPATQLLPFTYDLGRVAAFLDGVRTTGVDTQGTDVGVALVQALDRMGWRANARRVVTVTMDTRVGDPERACSVAADHFRHDGTRVSVWYVRHSRTTIPESVVDLARAGGGDEATVVTPSEPDGSRIGR